jgi:tetratricopeptide (TPR) repeat protein
MIAPETSSLIAKGLGLLGSACVHLGEIERAEEIYRLGVQYGQEGPVSAEIFTQFGEALLMDGRPGEAIGLLRRALALGADPKRVQPRLARAFRLRHRFVAARACLLAALDAGVDVVDVWDDIRPVREALGDAASRLPVELPSSLDS